MITLNEVKVNEFEILSRLGSYKKLKDEYWTNCPFHLETTADKKEFSVNFVKGIYSCFNPSCPSNCNGKKGGHVTELAKHFGITLESDDKPLEIIKIKNPSQKIDKGLTLDQYADKTQLPIEFLKNLGLRDATYNDRGESFNAVYMPNKNWKNEEVAGWYRLSTSREFRWNYSGNSGEKLLYGEWNLNEFADYVLLVEGQSDTQTALFYDINVLGVPGAKFLDNKPELLDRCKQFKVVYVWQESDDAGRLFAETIAKILPQTKIIKSPEYKDISELHKGGENVVEYIARLKDNAIELEVEKPFLSLTLKELLSRPPKQWLVDNLIGKNDLAMIFGDPGSGKTFVAIEMLISMATANTFADSFAIIEPLNVVYSVGEGLGGLRDRFGAAMNKHELKDLTNLTIIPDTPQLFEQTTPQNIINFAKLFIGKKIDVVIIDTLHSATCGADENLAKDMSVVLQNLKYLRKELNCSIILVHHTNKSGGYRGSSALHGAMDTMLQTKKDEDGYAWLECFKQKDGKEFTKIPFKIESSMFDSSAHIEWNETKADEQKEEIETQILDLLKDKPNLNQTEIVNELKLGRNLVLKFLKELELTNKVCIQLGLKNSKVYCAV